MKNIKKYGILLLKVIICIVIAIIAIAVTKIFGGSSFLQGWIGGCFCVLMMFSFGIMKQKKNNRNGNYIQRN